MISKFFSEGLDLWQASTCMSRRMVKCRDRSDNDRWASFHGTRRSKGIWNSKARLEDSNWLRLRIENQVLTSQLQPATEIVNELQRSQDSLIVQKKAADQEIHDLNHVIQSLSDAAVKDTDKRLEVRAKLNSSRLQVIKRDQMIIELENIREELETRVEELEIRVEKMQKQLCRELESPTHLDGFATPVLLESTMKALQTSTASFAKLFSPYCKSRGFDAHCALRTHFQNTYLTRAGHVTYMLKAWIFDTLFQDFENESFKRGGASIFLDDTARRKNSYECFELLQRADFSIHQSGTGLFQEFRHQKLQDFLSLWQSSDLVTDSHFLWEKLEDPVEDPEAVGSTAVLMETFNEVAKGAWTLHKLSLSFQPRADIFRVNQTTKFDPEFMESVVSVQDDERFISEVGFMICPGFRLRRSIVKCQIYLTGTPSSHLVSNG